MSAPQRWADKYLDIPFVEKGFDRSGCHCWGIVYLVFLKELGIELPKYLEFSAVNVKEVHKAINEGKQLDPWIPVIGPRRPFDVVVLKTLDDAKPNKIRYLECHVGVASSSQYVLHVEGGSRASNADLNSSLMRRRLVGAYRHKLLV